MYKIINNHIHVTRGSSFSIKLKSKKQLNVGDIFTFSIVEKGKYNNILFQKSYEVLEESDTMYLSFSDDDTRFDSVISKPKVYWYEIEYNGKQMAIGYDDDGPKQFILYPEAELKEDESNG